MVLFCKIKFKGHVAHIFLLRDLEKVQFEIVELAHNQLKVVGIPILLSREKIKNRRRKTIRFSPPVLFQGLIR